MRGLAGLAGRRVVLGVTGGIAAYKAVEVCRALVGAGAWVTPVLTAGATRFVGVATFSALASEPVRDSLWEPPAGPDRIAHTQLAGSAELVVVVPASASFIARCTAGLADDLLGAILLATRAPVLLAPAMHTEMWEHPATRHNVAILADRGVHLVGPVRGALAGAGQGMGRLAEPAEILAVAASLVGSDVAGAGAARGSGGLGRSSPGDLAGVRVLVSAGGTREPLDPVRFIGNRSSGRQGHALAFEAVARSATVTLVTTADQPVPAEAEVVRVETAAQMHAAVLGRVASSDAVVLAAAVADWRPAQVSSTKLRRSGDPPELVLEAVPDISAAVADMRVEGQLVVGFAAELAGAAAELVELARCKLVAKGLDLIVANDVSSPGVGFDHDTNAVSIVSSDGSVVHVGLTDKASVARAILDEVVPRLKR